MNKVAIIISPNYQNHARHYLSDCIESLRNQNWTGEKKIFLTDNESTESSFKSLKEIAPEVEIIRNANNDGFSKGNNDSIKLALKEGYNFIFLLNMDTIVETDCISNMISVVESDSNIGAVQARLMLWTEKDRINSIGNVTHFLGFGYCDGYGERMVESSLSSTRDICFPSGAAALFKKDVLEKIGLFDETFWMYNEDNDLGWRIWLAGWRCVLAPQAVVYHKYEFSSNSRKYYWLDRNRILTIIKNYSLVTLLLIAPAFVLMELGLLLFAFQKGWLKDKIKVYYYFLNYRNWQHLIRARRKTQSLRLLKDRDMIDKFSGQIWYEEIGGWTLRFVNPILNVYWQIIKWIIKNGARH